MAAPVITTMTATSPRVKSRTSLSPSRRAPKARVASKRGRRTPVDHQGNVASVIAEIRAQVRERNSLQRGEIAFGNMAKSVLRLLARDATSFPSKYAASEFLRFEKELRRSRRKTELVIRDLTEQLPVNAWWTSQRGLAFMGLAQIVAIAGDLTRFAWPAKLWKFMSMHVVDGRAARRARGRASEGQGFSPFRRMVMHLIGDALMKQNRGEYRRLYDDRKAMELERLPEGKGRKGWAHARALRYIEKRVLRDLWRVWRAEHKERCVWPSGQGAETYGTSERAVDTPTADGGPSPMAAQSLTRRRRR